MKYNRHIYAAIQGRPESHPQDLAGILRHIGQEKGVLAEADLHRFPNHAELSFGLQSLIAEGAIAEVSPRRYYDAAGSSHQSTFTGFSPADLDEAYAGYFQGLHQGRAWKLDLAHWPGPDRARWGLNRDIISPSTDGQFACVLYSCADVNIAWTVGLLAVLKGPPERPTVILRPTNFTCYVGPDHSVQWLDGGRYCVVVPYLFNRAANDVELLAFTFLDLAQERFAHYQMTDILSYVGQEFFEEEDYWLIRAASDPDGKRQETKLVPGRLDWHPWQELRGTSPAPSVRSLRGRRFIETPYGPAVQGSEVPNERRWYQFWKTKGKD
jgi:hypothetical protein